MSQFILETSKLSIAERIQLVQEILKTISDESGQSSDTELMEAQLKEIERRSESIKSGEAKTVSWDSIADKLKQRYES